MTMDDLREKVARAICEERYHPDHTAIASAYGQKGK